ncbi:MAG: hypothetical protein GY874_05500, partial [Desulfobacteraceae bacterium]|nr:hypothetical protein [Desulfobacteraceae bacterium]
MPQITNFPEKVFKPPLKHEHEDGGNSPMTKLKPSNYEGWGILSRVSEACYSCKMNLINYLYGGSEQNSYSNTDASDSSKGRPVNRANFNTESSSGSSCKLIEEKVKEDTVHNLSEKKNNSEIRDLNKDIEKYSKLAKEYFYSGENKIKQEDYEGAINDFNEAIKNSSNCADAYCRKADAKEKLNKIKRAYSDYNKAIEFRRKCADAHFYRGVAKHKLKEYKESIKDFSKVIGSESEYATEAYFYRGVAKANLDNHQDAINDLDLS